MGRSPHTTRFTVLPKIWVLQLLWLFRAKIWELNAQLTLPPDPTRPLKFRAWPPPILKHRVPRYFEQALRKGHDPSSADFLEPGSDQKFNLFLRVARHVPTSEDWLFRPLWPYCQRQLPSVDYATDMVDALLDRMGLRRLGGGATCFAMCTVPRLTRARENACLLSMAENPEPIHLMLLIALFHERKWHFPESDETDQLYQLCHHARSKFIESDQFTWCEEARSLQNEIDRALWSILLEIHSSGHRSPAPAKTRSWLFEPAYEVLRRVPARHCVVAKKTTWFDEADLCAGLGDGIPASWFLHERSTAYSASDIPTRAESRTALRDLMAAADIDQRQLFRYERDPSVLAELATPSTATGNSQMPYYGHPTDRTAASAKSHPITSCATDD